MQSKVCRKWKNDIVRRKRSGILAVDRFHFCMFGREFKLVAHHKPLEIIFGLKSKPCALIKRWVLRLQSYQYKVIYRSGNNYIAEPLSRLVIDSKDTNMFDEHSEHYVNWIINLVTPKIIQTNDIIEYSIEDKTIKAVKTAVYHNTWTDNLKPFKLFESELCFAGDILLRGTRIIMPEALRERTLQLAHEGHPGPMKRKNYQRSPDNILL